MLVQAARKVVSTPLRVNQHSKKPSVVEPTQHINLRDDEAFVRLQKLSHYSASILPILIEDGEDQSGYEKLGLEVRELPSDLIETPRIRFKQKPDREDPRAEIQNCFEIEKRLCELKAELDGVIADYKAGESVNERKTKCIRALADLYKDIDVEIRESKNYQHYKDTQLALQKERDATYKMLKEGENNGTSKERQSILNYRLLRVLKILTKVHIMKAGMLLNNRARSRGQTACATAYSALNSAIDEVHFFVRELNYRALRLEHAPKIRQMKISDGGGEEVWSTNLGNLNVEFVKKPGISQNEELPVRIKQKKWIVPVSTLINIRRHIKRGEIEEANKKLDLLIRLYNALRVKILTNNKDILKDLRKLKRVIVDLPDNQIPDPRAIENITNKIKDLVGIPGKTSPRISANGHWVWMEIEYKNLGSSTRSQLYTLAGERSDYALIAQNKAQIEEYAALLEKAASKSALTQKNKKIIETGINHLALWTGRGFVFQKQFATTNLQAALELTDAGFKIEDEKPKDAKDLYQRAESHLREAAVEVSKRLSEIERIAGNIKERTDSLYSVFRDNDIKGRADKALNVCREGNYRDTLKQLAAVRSRYFIFPLLEPGYIRANELLGEIETLVHRTSKIRNSKEIDEKLKIIESKVNLLKSDIEHKQSYRVLLHSIKTGEGRYCYAVPGMTLAGLLSKLGINTDTVFISLGNGRIQNSELSQVKLSDETPTISFSNEPPLKGYRAAQRGKAHLVHKYA